MKKIIFTIKIINLNTKIFTKKIIVAFILKINSGSIYIKIVLIN